MSTPVLGLLAAFIAFLSWGLGDFAIQRSVRAIGMGPTLASTIILALITA